MVVSFFRDWIRDLSEFFFEEKLFFASFRVFFDEEPFDNFPATVILDGCFVIQSHFTATTVAVFHSDFELAIFPSPESD